MASFTVFVYNFPLRQCCFRHYQGGCLPSFSTGTRLNQAIGRGHFHSTVIYRPRHTSNQDRHGESEKIFSQRGLVGGRYSLFRSYPVHGRIHWFYFRRLTLPRVHSFRNLAHSTLSVLLRFEFFAAGPSTRRGDRLLRHSPGMAVDIDSAGFVFGLCIGSRGERRGERISPLEEKNALVFYRFE